ncbi:MAG: phosphoribosylanthranilate isomerase [Myxococcales bacterium]|nr:phosphoribosylanthranilate isomerase [Myxococcales bacterium]
MSFIIKVCGVTRPEDAEVAVAEKVDAIGLNFWRGSKRYVDDDRAREILSVLPPNVLKVGVFVNAHPLVVEETSADLKLDRIQLHGDERVGDWAHIGSRKLIRALRVIDEASLKEGLGWDAGLYICDAYADGYGGSGKPAPWDLIAERAPRPFLLAGGLTPENVVAGMEATRPNGVDVASGVESEPGIKDHGRLRAFIRTARQASRTLGLR